MPREQIFTPELQSQFCAMIRIGCSRRRAARLLGINESTVRAAMTRDDDFMNQVHRGESHREALALSHIRNAAEKHWRAGAWLLERINPREFGKRRHVAVTQTEFEGLSVDLMASLMGVIKNPDDRRAVQEKLERIHAALEKQCEWEDGTPPEDLRPEERPGEWLDRMLDDERAPPPNEASSP